MLEGCRWPFPHTKPRQTLQTLADVHSKIPFTFSYLRNNERKYNSASIYFQTPSKRRISTIWGPCAFLNLNKVPFRKKEGKVPCIITFNLFMNLDWKSNAILGPNPRERGGHADVHGGRRFRGTTVGFRLRQSHLKTRYPWPVYATTVGFCQQPKSHSKPKIPLAGLLNIPSLAHTSKGKVLLVLSPSTVEMLLGLASAVGTSSGGPLAARNISKEGQRRYLSWSQGQKQPWQGNERILSLVDF